MEQPEVWTAQGAGHDKMLISALQKDDIIRQMINVELDLLQLHAGVPWNVLSCPGQTVCHYIPKCCSTHTWDFND